MKSHTIVLTGGGTGGSVTALLAIAGELRQQTPGYELLFIGSTHGPEAGLCEAAGIPFQTVPAGKLRRYWSWRNLSDVVQILAGYRAARRIFQHHRPAVVVSAGSFVGVPVIWAARHLGAKVVIHQQDVRPGLANRLTTAAADIITVVFEKSKRSFPAAKVRLTGNPVRSEILHGSIHKAHDLFNLVPDVPTLLVMGGGTGSSALNAVVGASAYRLVQHWQILHITGRFRDMPTLRDDRYHLYDFLTWQFPHALAAADVVISRCGLGAITELAATRKPTLFVPLPGTHQEENAALLGDLQAGMILPQTDLTADKLIDRLEDLRRHPERGKSWANNLFQLYRPDASRTISEAVISLLRP